MFALLLVVHLASCLSFDLQLFAVSLVVCCRGAVSSLSCWLLAVLVLLLFVCLLLAVVVLALILVLVSCSCSCFCSCWLLAFAAC